MGPNSLKETNHLSFSLVPQVLHSPNTAQQKNLVIYQKKSPNHQYHNSIIHNQEQNYIMLQIQPQTTVSCCYDQTRPHGKQREEAKSFVLSPCGLGTINAKGLSGRLGKLGCGCRGQIQLMVTQKAVEEPYQGGTHKFSDMWVRTQNECKENYSCWSLRRLVSRTKHRLAKQEKI